MNSHYVPAKLQSTLGIASIIELAAEEMLAEIQKSFRIDQHRPRRRGNTLRPGKDTPLWNELRRQLQPYLRKYGHQANLGRLLALPRQRINSYVTGGKEMPDAERTLQLIAWLTAVKKRKSPG